MRNDDERRIAVRRDDIGAGWCFVCDMGDRWMRIRAYEGDDADASFEGYVTCEASGRLEVRTEIFAEPCGWDEMRNVSDALLALHAIAAERLLAPIHEAPATHAPITGTRRAAP